VRRTSSTSSASVPPRNRITVAAWRGLVAGPGLYSSPEDAGWPCCGALIYPVTLAGGNLARMSTSTTTLQRWIGESCGFIYDPEEGDPDGGIPPGTAFEDIPDTWFCPVCGARKRDFVLYEE
jgi:rubredoxin